MRYFLSVLILLLLAGRSDCLASSASVAEEADRLHPGYDRLRDAIARYRALLSTGGWTSVTSVPPGPALKNGSSGPWVSVLRKRLLVTGDLTGPGEGVFYDASVEEAVRRFQKRHGLEADGIVGAKTLKALNVPLEARIRQMEINLDRWRRFPSRLPERYILVNSADFSLDVIEKGKSVLSMLVVVGKPYWRTPSFSAKMTYMVFNPSWYVPRGIAVREILPKVQKDPKFLSSEDFRVLKGAKEMELGTFDWAAVNQKNFDLRFIQRPGPRNPLGTLKFMFPNRYNVYMHDTPARELFSAAVRTFSHGCIRLEKPVELAMYLLGWSPEEVLAEIEKGEEKTLKLPVPIDVHLYYWTSWVDEYGAVQFRNDIYKRDI